MVIRNNLKLKYDTLDETNNHEFHQIIIPEVTTKKCFFSYIHLDLFGSHPSNYSSYKADKKRSRYMDSHTDGHT